MPTYSIFGLHLTSDIELQEAIPVASRGAAMPAAPASEASCVVRHRPEPAPPVPHRLVGEEPVYGDLKVRSYETPAGRRLVYDDTGTFDVTEDGGMVTWWGGDQPPSEAVQTDVLGRVLAMALHGQGILTLHASAVSINGEGVVFLAPKGFGKSSLAAALLNAGAVLISDDTVAVDDGDTPLLRPGVQTLRLRSDLAARYVPAEASPPNDKLHFRPGAPRSVGLATTPLRAIYLLEPIVPAPDEPVASRDRQSPVAATITVTTFRKLGALLDGRSGTSTFQAAADLVTKVPLYTLRIQRSLDRLEDVAAQIVHWHCSVPAAR